MPSLRDELRHRIGEWPPPNLPTPWRDGLECALPNFDALDGAALQPGARILPLPGVRSGIFYALEGVVPSDVSVAVIGNDPYPDPCWATGRSFEQGNLTTWINDLGVPRRVSPSLLKLICAIAALQPGAEELRLDCDGLKDRARTLRNALQQGVALQPPQSMFEFLTGQGVLWLNRTLTIGAPHQGTARRPAESERRMHRELWHPVMRRITALLVEEARERTIVFALFGAQAKEITGWIEDEGRLLQVPPSNLAVIRNAHPSAWIGERFFSAGNPLARINERLTAGGCEPIDWYGAAVAAPTASHTVDGMSLPACSARSAAIIDRTAGKYWTTLQRLANR